MEEVGKEGRTVLFVSHNMATLTTLCQRAIWLINGQVNSHGDAQQITSEYLTYGAEDSGEIVFEKNKPNHKFHFKRLSLLNIKEEITSVFDVKEPIKVCLEYQLTQTIKNLEISLRVRNSAGIPIFSTNRSSSKSLDIKAGDYISEIEIPSLLLAPDSYSFDIGAHIPNVEILSEYQSLMTFKIEETGSSMSLYKSFGVIILDLPWKELSIA